MHQHVREFTRVRGNNQPSLLDLVLSHDPLEVEGLWHSAPMGRSDHCLLTFRFIVDRGNFLVIKHDKRNVHKADNSEARRLFGLIDWDKEMKGKDVEQQAWVIFLQHYHEVVQKTAPLYKVHKGEAKKEWMTNEVLRLIQKKETMWNNYRKKKSSKRKLRRYRQVRNQVTTVTSRAVESTVFK